jgi:hypothetical protein
MADSPDMKSFLRGLFAALLVVVFTQGWLWYGQNSGAEMAIYDIKTEIRENASLIDSLNRAVSGKSTLNEADWLHTKHILEKLSRAAYERSRPSFDNKSSRFHISISNYYGRLVELESQADNAYEQTEYMLRQEERFEKEQDAEYQQLLNLALSGPASEKTAALSNLMKKKVDVLSSAVAQSRKFREGTSQGGLKVLLSELKVVELTSVAAEASTDGLIAQNHMDRILLVGFLFLMPSLILFAIIPASKSGIPRAPVKSTNDSSGDRADTTP